MNMPGIGLVICEIAFEWLKMLIKTKQFFMVKPYPVLVRCMDEPVCKAVAFLPSS